MTMGPVEIERKVRQLDNDVQSIYTMLSAIQGTQERHTNRLGELAVKVDSLDTGLDSLQTRLGSVDTRLDNVETKLGSVDTRLNSLQTKLGSVATNVDAVLALLQNPRA